MDRIDLDISRAARRALLGILFCLGTLDPASAQLGHVVKAQKISDTSGGFTATLEDQDQFGRAIVNLGDLDGDGVTDLLVSAHTDDDGLLYGLDRGAVYILFMHPNGFVKSWQKISDLYGNFSGHLDPGDQFGRAAACLGDLDGDGVVDVAVSSNYDDDTTTNGPNRGAIYILFLNTDGTVKSTQKISSTQGGLPDVLKQHDEFGRSIVNLGDMDGDGLADIVVGTPEDDDGGTNTGALHVLFLNSNGTVKTYRRISRSTDGLHLRPGDWFGHCMANLGDFDHDGVTDLVVGAVLDDDGGVNQGAIWILYLNANGSVKEAHEINELVGGFTAQLDDIDQFGTSVTALGDLDGDGVTDIAVGAVKDDDGGLEGDPDADVGAVYVLFLKPDATVKSWVKISDTTGDLPYSLDPGDWFGCALGRLGGSPLDGLFNVAIGGRYDNDGGGNHGAIYMVQLNDGTAPMADFVADRTLGVAPMTVNFTDTSTGEVTSHLWNFSDPPVSTQTSPSKTFTTPGTYDIQLTAKGPKGTDVQLKRDLITVSAGPLAFFDAAPRVGPCPLDVTFADHSEGTVTSWAWDFGDGTTSNVRNPTHAYSGCARYTVTLTVTGPNGVHSLTETDFVVVALGVPLADLAATPTSGLAPLSVQFDDLSTGQVSAWAWSFGDGQSSSSQAPLHVYSAPGTYTVSLTATGIGGSTTKTVPGLISVGIPPPVTYFEANPVLGPAPLTVAFTDLTTGDANVWSWDFGDGTFASEQNPVHVYTAPGTYSVTLTAQGAGGSNARTRASLITAELAPPGAAFVASPVSGPAPLGVQFTDRSTLNVKNWTWDFGDGGSSNVANPLHVYTVAGIYSVALTVSGQGGSDTVALTDLVSVSVQPTTAAFGSTPASGVAPLSVAFTDQSSSNVTAWTWDFGDGSGSSARSPTHVFGNPGSFTVTETVTSPTGNASLSKPGCVLALTPPPVAAFNGTPTSGIYPLSVQFNDRSSGTVTSYSWDFGDGTSSRERLPLHVYQVPGSFTVSLTVSGPGGSNTITGVDYVQAIDPAPNAQFNASPTTGVAPLQVQFGDLSTGNVTARSWDFGDGGSSSLSAPAHLYATPGTYSVTLTVTGPGGTDLAVRADLIVVRDPAPVAAFTSAPGSGIAPLPVQFTNASTGNVSAWTWSFGDGTSSNLPSPLHLYALPGRYTVTLTVTGPGGSDDETKPDVVLVNASTVIADFRSSAREGYAPLPVTFTDLTVGIVTSWSWAFGDGTTSTLRNPAHVYAAPGVYDVDLAVTGPGGTGARTRTINVLEVPAFGDGSFEAQTAGAQLAPPWRVYHGTGSVVFPKQVASDNGFPSAGTQWACIGADGSNNTTPPSNPGGQGTSPRGAAGIQQDFAFSSSKPHLLFDAAFLLNGNQDTAAQNDFMSVDVTDDKTTWNLFYADTFSDFPRVSAQYGWPMTAIQHVQVDLRALFPTAVEGSLLRLRVGLANGGNGANPSRGYVDRFRLEPSARAEFRNGHDLNPVVYASSPAVIGGEWTVTLDTDAFPAASGAYVSARTLPLSGIKLSKGEALIAGPLVFQVGIPLTGLHSVAHFPVPDDASLIGTFAPTQVVLFGSGVHLGNAYDLWLGY